MDHPQPAMVPGPAQPGDAGSAGAGAGPSTGGGGGLNAAAAAAAAAPLYHVAAVDQGLHLEPETLSYWGYDDGTSTLLVAKGGLVFAYDMSPGLAPGSADQLKWTFPLSDGPPVRCMRLSLDGALLAIQRSAVMLEFAELATGNVFVQGTDRGRGEILAFFFTELAGAEVVLVTPTGLELLEFVPRRQGLRLRERVRMPIEWALYTHETRMVLLGTAAGGASYIKAFQFVSTGLLALPPFTAGAAASALALMGSAAGGATGLVAGSPVAAAAVATPPARVPADCLRLLKVYGRVYCAHINRRSLKLELYRFYTDTVVLQHTYELFSPAVNLAVVDSVIIAHCTDAAAPLFGVAMLFDVAAPTAQTIANPLPLAALRHAPGDGAAAEAAVAAAAAEEAEEEAPGGGGGGGAASSGFRRWEYLTPNVVLDRGGQTAYRLGLNLPAVAESCSDPAIAVGFLQRRRGPLPAEQPATLTSVPAPVSSPEALLLSVVRTALQERMPMTTVRAIFEDLCAGYAAALDRELAALAAAQPAPAAGAPSAAAAAAPPPPPPPPGAVAMPQYLTADELASEVFRWLHDEEVVDAPYLQAALYEYMSAAAAAGIPLPQYLQELSIDILLQQSQENQVLQLLYTQADHVAPPVVQRLLAAGPGDTQPPAGDRDGGGGSAAAAAEPPVDGAAAGAAEQGGGEGGPLCRQLAIDALARGALAARYEPVAVQPGSGLYGIWMSQGGVGDAASYVEALLAQGDVLRAARVMRRYRVTKPSVKEFLAAVGARGDEAALAAVYRTFQDELLASYPKYDLAARKLLQAPQPTPAA